MAAGGHAVTADERSLALAASWQHVLAMHHGFAVDGDGQLMQQGMLPHCELLWDYNAVCDEGDKCEDMQCKCPECEGKLQIPPSLLNYSPSHTETASSSNW